MELDYKPMLEGKTVFEPDSRRTSLLDQYGNPIYVVPKRDPIGFVRFPVTAGGNDERTIQP